MITKQKTNSIVEEGRKKGRKRGKCRRKKRLIYRTRSEIRIRILIVMTTLKKKILRNHIMVRVGGGWDTLENYLNKHDPCRCVSSNNNNNESTASHFSGNFPLFSLYFYIHDIYVILLTLLIILTNSIISEGIKFIYV